MTSEKSIRTRRRESNTSIASSPSASATATPLPSDTQGSDEYDVGYGKPPKDTQFKPGQSGNPEGRPKGSRNLKIELAEELQERILIKESGERRKVSKQRAMLKSLTAKAVQGDARAANLVLNLVLRLLSQDDDEQPIEMREEDLAILEAFETRVRQHANKVKD